MLSLQETVDAKYLKKPMCSIYNPSDLTFTYHARVQVLWEFEFTILSFFTITLTITLDYISGTYQANKTLSRDRINE